MSILPLSRSSFIFESEMPAVDLQQLVENDFVAP